MIYLLKCMKLLHAKRHSNCKRLINNKTLSIEVKEKIVLQK